MFLESEQTIAVSVQIIEAFVRLRKVSLSYADIAAKIGEIESRLAGHDEQFQIFHEIICRFWKPRYPAEEKSVSSRARNLMKIEPWRPAHDRKLTS